MIWIWSPCFTLTLPCETILNLSLLLSKVYYIIMYVSVSKCRYKLYFENYSIIMGIKLWKEHIMQESSRYIYGMYIRLRARNTFAPNEYIYTFIIRYKKTIVSKIPPGVGEGAGSRVSSRSLCSVCLYFFLRKFKFVKRWCYFCGIVVLLNKSIISLFF